MPANRPEEIDQLFEKYIKAGDLDALMGLYEPQAAFPNPQGEVKVGLDAVRQEMAPFADMKPTIQMNIKKIVQTGDIALIHNEWKMPDQGMAGYAVEVARRQADGTWLMVIDDPFTIESQGG